MASNYKGLLIMLVSLLAQIQMAQSAIFSHDQENNIQDYIEKMLECRNLPGLSLTVLKGDESWVRGFGLADIETQRPVTNTTVFPIGSLTKAMTMTLLGKYLNGEGFNWDSKLQDIVEAFDTSVEFPNDNLTSQVRVSDLLAHRTGMSSVADYGFIAGYPPNVTREAMAKKVEYVPVQSELGANYIYNNLMYMVLGYTTGVMGGASWEELIEKELLKPIGMKSSEMLDQPDDVLQDNVAKPYIFKDGQMQLGDAGIYNITPLEPAGSLMSTGLDMAKWLKFLLDGATTHNGKALLTAELFEQATTEQFTFPTPLSDALSIKIPTYPVDDVTTGYGYAWFTSTYRDHRRLWHSGGLFSYISMVWLYPDSNIAIFASTNGNAIPRVGGNAMKTLFWYLSDILLGFEPWLDLDTVCTFPSPWKPTFTYNLPPHPVYTNENLSNFTGIFVSDLLPSVMITPKNNPPSTLKFEMNRITGTLYPTSDVNILAFEMSEPWEYAIERVVSDNYTIRYPVTFIRSTDNDVIGFNISFGVTVPFRSNSHLTRSVHPVILLSVITFVIRLVSY